MAAVEPLAENCSYDSNKLVEAPLDGTITTTSVSGGTGWYTCPSMQFNVAVPAKPPKFDLKLKYGCFNLGKYELEHLAKALELSLQTQSPFQVTFMGQLLQTEQLLDLLQHLKANKNKSLSELLEIDLHQIIADCEEVVDEY